MLEVCGIAAAVALFVGLILPFHQRFYFSDDFVYIDWVVRHLRSPWAALGPDATLFHHLRPATNLAWWAGIVLGGGRCVGPHAVQFGLLAVAYVSLCLFAWERSGSRHALWVTGLLLALPMAASELLRWMSYMSSAGEMAAGFGAVLVAAWAIRRDSNRLFGVALALVALAGGFKEPGWVIYPAAIVTLLWSQQVRSRRWRGRLIAVVAVAVIGFVVTFSSANVQRYETRMGEMAVYLFAGVLFHLGEGVDGWPLERGAGGIPALLLAAVIWRDLLGRRVTTGVGWLAAWVALGASTAVVWTLWADLQGPTLGALVLAVLVRRIKEPPVGLVIAIVGVAILLPAPMRQRGIHTLAAMYGLVLYTGVGVVALARELPAVWRKGGAGKRLLAGVLMASTLAVCAASVVRIEPRRAQRIEEAAKTIPTREQRNRVTVAVMADLAHQLAAEVSCQARPGASIASILPLAGVTAKNGPSLTPWRLAVSDQVGFPATEEQVAALLSTATKHRVRKRGLQRIPIEQAGHYAVLAAASPGAGTGGVLLIVEDNCGHQWRLKTSRMSGAYHAVLGLGVEPGCQTLSIRSLEESTESIWIREIDEVRWRLPSGEGLDDPSEVAFCGEGGWEPSPTGRHQ